MSSMTRSTGKSSVDGAVIYRVPDNTKATLTGMLVSNADKAEHTVSIYLNDILISGLETRLKPGSSIEFILKSHNLIAGDKIVAYSDMDEIAHVLISYYETLL